MTDPLSAKELVEKTYLYVDRVVKECRKNLLPQILSQKKTLDEVEIGPYLGRTLEEWFNKRDRLLNIKWQKQSVKLGSKNDVHLKFEGRNKDAVFTVNCDAELLPIMDPTTGAKKYYLKNVNIVAERSNFRRP
ncbi:MAG: hypothetical protein QW514_03670 [Thermoprotei archaeon]